MKISVFSESLNKEYGEEPCGVAGENADLNAKWNHK